MEASLRNIYDTFLDSGELNIVFPDATGLWEKDKKKFDQIYSSMNISNISFPVIGDFYEENEDEWLSDFIDDGLIEY